MSDKKIFSYPGEQAEVHWDGRLCIHYEIAAGLKASFLSLVANPGVNRTSPWTKKSGMSSPVVLPVH